MNEASELFVIQHRVMVGCVKGKRKIEEEKYIATSLSLCNMCSEKVIEAMHKSRTSEFDCCSRSLHLLLFDFAFLSTSRTHTQSNQIKIYVYMLAPKISGIIFFES